MALASRYPQVDLFSRDAGHVPEELLGWRANPRFGLLHLLSSAFIGGGFILISAAWKILCAPSRPAARAPAAGMLGTPASC